MAKIISVLLFSFVIINIMQRDNRLDNEYGPLRGMSNWQGETEVLRENLPGGHFSTTNAI
jgi:hypothetical protein